MNNLNKSVLFFLLMYFSLDCLSQDRNIKLPANWYNLDLVDDGYFGISTNKAYDVLLNDLKPRQQVIVAVIDGGIDINHPDLKDVIWSNAKEIPNNGIDDDGNGYIDDVHGWNYIGSRNGNLAFDNLELVRLLRVYAPKYQSTTNMTPLDSLQKEEFRFYKKLNSDFGEKYEEASKTFAILHAINKVLDSVARIANKQIPSYEDIENYKADDEMEVQVKSIIRKGSKEDGGFDKFYKNIKEAYKQYDIMLKYNLNPKYDERMAWVRDDYADNKQRIYGNNDVKGPDAFHGTHVAGIIGADRNNNLGIMGVANNVLIMPIRVVPMGDERDKDVANGIRYAVDNGAKVINMSFGKSYKWDKEIVDEAVKYAESKGVLLVHAAGNNNQNNDLDEHYPNKYFDSSEAKDYLAKHIKPIVPDFIPEKRNSGINGQVTKPQLDHTKFNKSTNIDSAKFNLPHADNWIEVGASANSNDDHLKADFSNYGKYSVDVFAPGFMIKSTALNSGYEEADGTSMAAPIVSGLAALILSYYPQLTAVQVREIIISSVTKIVQKIKYKNVKGEIVRVPFIEICVSGGVVSAFKALKLASTYHRTHEISN